jgi:hypothetical protein
MRGKVVAADSCTVIIVVGRFKLKRFEDDEAGVEKPDVC